jgi:hypothetical protein
MRKKNRTREPMSAFHPPAEAKLPIEVMRARLYSNRDIAQPERTPRTFPQKVKTD